MVSGQSGVIGKHVQLRVEEELRIGFELVIAQHHSMAGLIVLVMIQSPQTVTPMAVPVIMNHLDTTKLNANTLIVQHNS